AWVKEAACVGVTAGASAPDILVQNVIARLREFGGGALVNLGFCFIRLAKVQNLSIKADFSLARPLIISNILLSALGGLMWYLQFFFYAWGHARIPAQYDYMSWMLHMSFYVLCGGLVGLVLKEWKNAGRRPVAVLSLGCVVIIIAANIVGLGMAS
ncbi:L-rhamnose/proton symporter RhaT, partial [Salmonella enterica]|uniref:L-rhamnose/proton symporter RhaT n=1 Tax=Salmonella enterica TaxID=28901 RepID=UPI00287B9A68